ncbi:MAG: hypothetical protein LBR23_09470 [Spirochaetaceae bacterium]|jgi:hypothetical protein|nr:hypothetical protein [Spirochaetaceae bacterium]
MTFSTTGSPIEARAQNESQFPIIFGVCAGVVLIAFLLLQLAKKIKAGYHTPEYLERQKQRTTNRKDIRAVTEEYGFTQEEAQFLEVQCRDRRTPNIRYLLKDHAQTLALIKELFQASLSESNPEGDQTLIFSIFKKINKIRLADAAMTTTATLPVGQKLLYVDSEGKKYTTSVIDNNEKGLTLSAPRDRSGMEVVPENLSKITLMMQEKNDIAVTIQVRVLLTQEKPGGAILLTTHGTHFESFLKHEYLYVHARLPCTLQPAAAKPGDGGEVTYVTESRTYKGLLLNYSGTSCNIVVKNPINLRQFLRMSVRIDGEHTEDFIVMAMDVAENKKDGIFVIHANFVKMSEGVKNYILSHIYSFTPE